MSKSHEIDAAAIREEIQRVSQLLKACHEKAKSECSTWGFLDWLYHEDQIAMYENEICEMKKELEKS